MTSRTPARFLAHFTLWVISGIVVSTNLFAEPLYQFHTLTKKDGMSSTVVYDVTQDKDGFMWFGTEDGLQKYDGFELKTYRHGRLKPNSITSNIVRSVLTDSAGRLWVGTENGLNLYQKNFR